MRPRALPRPALIALLTIGSTGCYAAHEQSDPSGETAVDDAYRTAATPRDNPSAPGCGSGVWSALAPPGLVSLRRPAIAAIDDGFVASIVHLADREVPSLAPLGYYPTALFRMRSDLSDALDRPRDAGVVSNEGGTNGRPALTAGGDGRLAACAAPHWDESSRMVPGGVAFFRSNGELERMVRLDAGCADVAWVNGRWIAVEIFATAPASTTNLFVFDEELGIERRVPLDATGIVGTPAMRIGSLHERAVLVGAGVDSHRIVTVDLDGGDVGWARLEAVHGVDLPESQFAVVDLGDVLGLGWVDEDGYVWWATWNDALEGSTPLLLGRAAPYTSYVEMEPLDGGAAMAYGAGPNLELVLLDETGPTAEMHVRWPSREGDGLESISIAVQDDVVAMAIEINNPSLASNTIGIWSARCRVR